jgi:hypothetical protein
VDALQTTRPCLQWHVLPCSVDRATACQKVIASLELLAGAPQQILLKLKIKADVGALCPYIMGTSQATVSKKKNKNNGRWLGGRPMAASNSGTACTLYMTARLSYLNDQWLNLAPVQHRSHYRLCATAQ